MNVGATGRLAWVLASSTLGCLPASNVCGESTAPLAQTDGGSYRCTRGEDCPRPDSIQVCVYDGLPEYECVSCEETVCLRHVPEPCQ